MVLLITEVLIFTIKTSKRHVNYAQLTTIINCDNKSQTNHALINTYKKVIKVITNSSKSKSKRSAKVTQGHPRSPRSLALTNSHGNARTITNADSRTFTPTHAEPENPERSRRLTNSPERSRRLTKKLSKLTARWRIELSIFTARWRIKLLKSDH